MQSSSGRYESRMLWCGFWLIVVEVCVVAWVIYFSFVYIGKKEKNIKEKKKYVAVLFFSYLFGVGVSVVTLSCAPAPPRPRLPDCPSARGVVIVGKAGERGGGGGGGGRV